MPFPSRERRNREYKRMKNKLALLVALLLICGAVGQAQAQAPAQTTEFRWQKFGEDPAYKTREAAMADRANVFRKFGYNESQVACLVAGTSVPGKLIRLLVGDRLKHMLSSKGVVHANTVIAFPLYERGIEYTARAEEWVVTCDGVAITINLPEICYNWSDRETLVPPVQKVACATLRAHIPAGNPGVARHSRIVRGTTLRRNPIEDFNCWGIIAGQYREGAPRKCDNCDWAGEAVAVMRERGQGAVAPFNTFIYEVPEDVKTNPDGSVDITVVLPPSAVEEGNGLCVEVDGVAYPKAVILPGSWKGLDFELPLDFWTSPRVINP